MIIQEPVQASIWFALNHYAYDDAIFLAERLHSEIGSDETLYLLATCYYRAFKPIAAYKILTKKPFKSSECRLLLAKCCCDLKKYEEAEKTLMYKWKVDKKLSSSKSILTIEELIAHFNESASFVSQLLGLICSKTDRVPRAIDYYKKSLRINPFLWSSFEKLIQLGFKSDSSKIFDINNVDFNMCHGFNPLVNLWNTNDKINEHFLSSSQLKQQQNFHTNNQNFNSINALDVQDRMNNCNNLTNTPCGPMLGMKELNQQFEIRSPFAFIKTTQEMSSIDVITPENNNWVTTACLAPQKTTINNSSTNNNVSSKTGRKLPTNLPKKFNNNSLQVDKTTSNEQSRLSFGVFALVNAETPPLSNLAIPNMILDHHDTRTSSDFIMSIGIGSNNCSTGNNSPLTTNTSVPGKISRAPIKKPQTRRGQQSSSLGLHNPASRNLASKLQLVNTVNTQLIDNNIYVNSTASTPNQNSTIQSLRRSSRLFNSSSSVKENNTKTTRNINQENNKKTLQTCSKTPTKRIKMSSNNNSSTSLHKSSNTPNSNPDNTDFNSTDYQKNEKNILITNQAINDDLKQAGIKMQRASAEGLLNLLSQLGQAALAIGQFKCEHAINILQKLPKKHYQSGYVLTAIGRAYFELGKYEEAVTFFEEARRREPYLLKGMEYYSTALWHLQREVQLSSLAQELIDYDRNAPQTWCVSGNCFSLQKEHETAIKFLQRAIQIDVDFAYAYTLLGHEFVLTEEMDNAMACFRNAIRIDNRHYNAFYGIGMIFYKQEKFKMAELHYSKALKISWNPVLLCHLAVVQHALKKSDAALQTLNKAIEMDPKNALCKFHRASIKFSMDDYDSALSELEELKQIVPKESLVYFLIGKVYKKLGNTHLALMNFSWAMDLDPKGANNQIKEVIDKQYPNEDEQVICSDPVVRNDSSTNSTDNSDNSLIRPHLSMSSSSDGMDEDDDS